MTDTPENASLDPEDWSAFRRDAHAMLDACLDHLSTARTHPWTAPPNDIGTRYEIHAEPRGVADVAAQISTDVLPYHGGNTHPQFWGWVQGSGLASDLIAAMASAVLNANLGGRHHGANEMERAVVDWTRRKMGMPEGASGVLVSGTSQATVIAFQAARLRAIGDLRNSGQNGQKLTAYAAEGVHNATRKALELLGIGGNNLRAVPVVNGEMDPQALRNHITQDRENGARPFLIVGTAGSVDLGAFDDLNALADIAKSEGLWLHVDGAFGAWTRLANAPYRALSDGIERADSIALDFHKWMYVGYDCGMVLIADEAEHRAAFAARPAYLQGADRGLAGGEPWFTDYGIDLSRGNRALKIWCALEVYGEAAFADAITQNCLRAAEMAAWVGQHPKMAVAHPVISNVCVFTARSELAPDAQSQLNSEIAQALQESGEAVFSTTIIGGITCLRAAIVNHRTRASDVEAGMVAMANMAGKILSERA